MTTQIAVKLPDELLAAIDRLVADNRFASRSEIVRAGIQHVVAENAERSIDEAFERGVAAFPDSDDDERRATSLALASIDEEPWEKWW